jgi:glycosyltransferase involved in cell wall biosynthesis
MAGDRNGRIRVMRIIARMNVGGPALQVTALARGLDPGRFDQRLYCGIVQSGEADFLDLRAPGIDVNRIRELGRGVRVAGDGQALTSLVRAMRQFRPHIVHTHTAKAGALGRTAAMLARAPAVVHTYHGHLLHGYFSPAKTRLVVGAERALARRSARLVAVGAHVRDDLVAAGVGRISQYVVVPPGVSLRPLPDRRAARRELGLPPAGHVVAYVGRLTGIKRPDRLLAVAHEVIRAASGTQFLVCGDGELRAETERAANGHADAIHFCGWRADVETVYAAADLMLLTSDNEGMPVSLIEAGLAGVPSVATGVGSVAEVVCHGQTGLLAADVTGLADGVLQLLRDENARHVMGRHAQAWAAGRFTAERLVSDIDGLYTAIAAEHGWWRGHCEPGETR